MQQAVDAYHFAVKHEQMRKKNLSKLTAKLEDLHKIKATQKDVHAALEVEADEVAVKMALGEDTSPPAELDAQCNSAANAFSSTERNIRSVEKAIEKLNSEYDVRKDHPVSAARQAVFQAAYEEARSELEKALPLIHRAYTLSNLAAGVSPQGNVLAWNGYLQTTNFAAPSHAQTEADAAEIEALLQPAD